MAHPQAARDAARDQRRQTIVLSLIAMLVLAGIGGAAIAFVYMEKKTGTLEVTIDNWGFNELNYSLYLNDELKGEGFIDGFTELTLPYEIKWRDDYMSVNVELYYGDMKQDRHLSFWEDGITLGVTFHISDIYPSI